MKKLLFVLALGCSLSAGAQLTVLENGQTVVGSPTSMTKVDSNATLNIWNHNPTSSTQANIGTISFGEGSKAKIKGKFHLR